MKGLQILPQATLAARNPAGMGPLLQQMLRLVVALCPAGSAPVASQLSAVPVGSGAIIIGYQHAPVHNPPLVLHYLLLGHTAAGWDVYNSNSHKLNPTHLLRCPSFNQAVTTTLQDDHGTAGGATETWNFLGVFIAV